MSPFPSIIAQCVLMSVLFTLCHTHTFGFTTATCSSSASSDPFTVTYYLGNTTFQCVIIPSSALTSYTCDTSLSTTTQCETSGSIQQYGIQIDSPSDEKVDDFCISDIIFNGQTYPISATTQIGDSGGYLYGYFDLTDTSSISSSSASNRFQCISTNTASAHSFGFITCGASESNGSDNEFTVTYYWGNSVFQCLKVPTTKSTPYICSISSFTTAECQTAGSMQQYGLQIDSPTPPTGGTIDDVCITAIILDGQSYSIYNTGIGDSIQVDDKMSYLRGYFNLTDTSNITSYNTTNTFKCIPINATNYVVVNKTNYVVVNNTNYEVMNNIETAHDLPLIIGISTGSLILIIFIISVVFYKNKRRRTKLESLTQYIKNPMVVSIAIGQYDNEPSKESVESVGGYFTNLDGIDIDIKNSVQLFHHTFDYEIYPEYDINEYIKQTWTQSEIMNILQKQANSLEDNVIEYDKNGKVIRNKDGYDGLIVIISCHGIKNHIVSSDYGKIEKSVIHQIFSIDHPKSRGIPRLFVFDCCDGNEDRETDWRASMDVFSDEETEKAPELGKNLSKEPELDKNMTVKSKQGGWYYGENNPDHKLAVIHASNQGFQSKMRTDTGSYVISKLVEKIKSNYESIKKPNKKFLYEILDEIQNELESSGKQLPVHTFNNGTGYIKFTKHTQQSLPGKYGVEQKEIEMNEYHRLGNNESNEHKIGDKTKSQTSEEHGLLSSSFMEKVQDMMDNNEEGIDQMMHYLKEQKELKSQQNMNEMNESGDL